MRVVGADARLQAAPQEPHAQGQRRLRCIRAGRRVLGRSASFSQLQFIQNLDPSIRKCSM